MGISFVSSVNTSIQHIQEAQRAINGVLLAGVNEVTVKWLKSNETRLETFKKAVEALYANVDDLQRNLKDQINTVEEKSLTDGFKALQGAWETLQRIQNVISPCEGGLLLGRIFSRKIAVKGRAFPKLPINELVKTIRAKNNMVPPKLINALCALWDLEKEVTTKAGAESKIDALQQYGLWNKQVYFFWGDTQDVFLTDNFKGKVQHRKVMVDENGKLLVGGELFSPQKPQQPLSAIAALKATLDRSFLSKEGSPAQFSKYISHTARSVGDAEKNLGDIRRGYIAEQLPFPGAAMIVFAKDGAWCVQLDDKGKLTNTKVDLYTEPGKIRLEGKTEHLSIPETYIDVSGAVRRMDELSEKQTKEKFASFCAGLPEVESKSGVEKVVKSEKKKVDGLCYTGQPSRGWWQRIWGSTPSQFSLDVVVVRNGVCQPCRVTAHHDHYEYEIAGVKGTVPTREELDIALGIKRTLIAKELIAQTTKKEADIRRTVDAINRATKFKPEEFAGEDEVKKYLEVQGKILGEAVDQTLVIWKKAKSGDGDDNFAEFYITEKTKDTVQTWPLNIRDEPGSVIVTLPKVAAAYKWIGQGVTSGVGGCTAEGGVYHIEAGSWSSILSGIAKNKTIVFPSTMEEMRTQMELVKKGVTEKAGKSVSLEKFKEALAFEHRVGDYLITISEPFLEQRKMTLHVAIATNGPSYDTYEVTVRPKTESPYICFSITKSGEPVGEFNNLPSVFRATKATGVSAAGVVARKEGALSEIWRRARESSFFMSDWRPEAINGQIEGLLRQTDTKETVWLGRDERGEESVKQPERGSFSLFRVVDWVYTTWLSLKDTAYSYREQAFGWIPIVKRLAPSAPPKCFLTFYRKDETGTIQKDEISVSFDVSTPKTPFWSDKVAGGKRFEKLEDLAKAYKDGAIAYKALADKANACTGVIQLLSKKLSIYTVGNPGAWIPWFMMKLRGLQPLEAQLTAAEAWSRKNKESQVVCMYKEIPDIVVGGETRKASHTLAHVITIKNGNRTHYVLTPRPDGKVDVSDENKTPLNKDKAVSDFLKSLNLANCVPLSHVRSS